jgi:hypothetical protein
LIFQKFYNGEEMDEEKKGGYFEFYSTVKGIKRVGSS